ncbi:hypothetical protein MML48_4g00018683 [Holotrichia oblita]|uniref:Uncharacterized protein n=1 Tax=Holotrichia oblita TaxID=644536 RepID=A0ACB9TA14_HOLOL|nr:hypothetical protein MML48_4g00018683 [Holotrichia oblita]
MDEETSACKRAANFSAEEIDMLIDLIKKKKKHIIESKKTDRILWKEKDEAWKDVAKEFNAYSNSNIYRSALVLKKKYENIKKRTKQKFADNRHQLTATGGGPSSDIKISTVDEDIKDLLGVRLEGLPSYFDSDTTEENADNEEIIIVQSDPSSSSGQCWSTYTPSSLQEPISVPLQNNGNSSVTNEKWSSLADVKNDVLQIQKNNMEEEHQAKMHLLQEQKHLALLQIEEQKLKNEIVKLDLRIKQKTFENIKQ